MQKTFSTRKAAILAISDHINSRNWESQYFIVKIYCPGKRPLWEATTSMPGFSDQFHGPIRSGNLASYREDFGVPSRFVIHS